MRSIIVLVLLVLLIPLVSSCSYDYTTQCKLNYQICVTNRFPNQTCDCFESLVSCFNEGKCVDNRTLVLLKDECEKLSCRSNCSFEENDNSDAIDTRITLGITLGIPLGFIFLGGSGIGIYACVSNYRDAGESGQVSPGDVPGTNRGDVEMNSGSGNHLPSSYSEQSDASDDETRK